VPHQTKRTLAALSDPERSQVYPELSEAAELSEAPELSDEVAAFSAEISDGEEEEEGVGVGAGEKEEEKEEEVNTPPLSHIIERVHVRNTSEKGAPCWL